MITICYSGGECEVKAKEMAADFAKVGFSTLGKKANAYQVCGTMTKVNLYSGCKVIA